MIYYILHKNWQTFINFYNDTVIMANQKLIYRGIEITSNRRQIILPLTYNSILAQRAAQFMAEFNIYAQLSSLSVTFSISFRRLMIRLTRLWPCEGFDWQVYCTTNKSTHEVYLFISSFPSFTFIPSSAMHSHHFLAQISYLYSSWATVDIE